MARWLRNLGGKSRSERRRSEGRRRAGLQLEPLEHRLMLTQTIINTNFVSLPDNVRLQRDARHVSVDSGYVRLTGNKDELGSLIVKSSGKKVTDFTATFNVSIKNGTKADGMSFGYGEFNNAAWGEEGPSGRKGVWLSIDTYKNHGSDPTGLEIWYNNTRYFRKTVPVDQLRGGFKKVVLGVGGDGQGSLSYEGVGTFSFTIPPMNPSTNWRFGAGARTGSKYDWHVLEDLKIVDNREAPSISLSGSSGKVKDTIFDTGNPSLSYSVSDANHDLQSVSAYLEKPDGKKVSSTSFSHTFAQDKSSPLGKYTLTVTATDRSGEVVTASRSYTLEDNDEDPPTITRGGRGGTDGSEPYLSWSISDPSGIYSREAEIYLQGIDDFIYRNTDSNSKTVKLSELPQFGEGTYTLRVRATDKDENRGPLDRESSSWQSTSITVKDDDSGHPLITLGGSGADVTGISGSPPTLSHGDNPHFTWNVEDRLVPGETKSGINRVKADLYQDGSLARRFELFESQNGLWVLNQDNVQKETFNSYPTSYTLNLNELGLTPLGTFRLEVYAEDKDNDGWEGDQLSATAERAVTLTNAAPVADAALNQTAVEGVGVRFDARGSTDDDNDALTYSWDFGDGSTGTGVQPVHAYADNGSYQARVTVSDGLGGTSTDTVTITVVNADPTISSVVNNGPVVAGIPVTVTVSASDAAGDDPLTYDFDFDNDGVFEISNTSGVATHTYTADNVYPVNVRVSDDDGGSDFGWTAVQVGAAPTTAATVQFTSSTTLTAETGVVAIQATLSEPVDASVLVPVALSGTASGDADYALPYSYILFPPNTTSANVTLDVLEDASDEYDESIVLQMLTPINAALGSVTDHTVTIADDDLPPTVMFTAATATAREEQGSIVITARVNVVSGKDITIPLEFAGTATAGSDYLPPSGAMVLAAGQEAVSREITIVNDSVGETNETILVSMGQVVNASPSTVPGTTSIQTITIPENDEPSISFQSVFQPVDEEDGLIQISASLSTPWPFGPISLPVSVAGTATLGSDYTIENLPNGTLTFPTDTPTATFSLRITNDSLQEEAETVELRLGAPTLGRLGATASHLVEIAASDTPTVEFVSSDSEHWEDAGSVPIRLRLSAPAVDTVTVPVDVYTSNLTGNEFTFTRTTATFERDEVEATVTIELHDDNVNEGLESIGLRINAAENADLGDGVYHALKIKDNDPFIDLFILSDTGEISAAATQWEGSNPVDVVARLSAPSNRDVTVQFATTGTALPYLDYTLSPVTVTIPGDQSLTDALLRIYPREDTLDESSELVYASIDTASNAQPRDVAGARVTILDASEPPTVNFQAFKGTVYQEGDRVELFVKVSPVSGQDVEVPITLSGGATRYVDYWIPTTVVTIKAGEPVGKFVFQLEKDEDEDEVCESIKISLGTPTNANPGKYSEATIRINERRDPGEVVATTLNIGSSVIGCISEVPGTETTFTPPPQGSAADADVSIEEEEALFRSTGTLAVESTALSGYIAGGIAFFDANKNGIRDFLDFNLDGVQDPNEPLEPAARTAPNGVFQLEIPNTFDLNGDGKLSWQEGQFATTGGTDTSTGLPLASTLLAPIGFTQITPLSTLASKLVNTGPFTPNEASMRVQEAFGLPPVALHATDMPAAVTSGDLVAPTVYREQVKTANSVAQIASLIASTPNAPPYSIVADAVADDMAQKLAASGSALDLSQPLVVEAVILGVLGRFGLSLSSDKVQGAAQVVVAGNQTLDGVVEQAEESFLESLARVKVVSQGSAADALGEVAAGSASIATVVAENTGAALQANVDAATVGNVLPVIIESSNPRVVEANSGQVMLEFEVGLSRTPAWPVSVDFETVDSTATVADGDYVFTSGSLNWAAGDTTPRMIQVPVVGDEMFEADEQFYVRFDNPQNSMLQARFARGQIINDDLLVFTASEEEGLNRLELRVSGSTFELFQNDNYVVGGVLSEPVPIMLRGAAGVGNHLTIEYLSPSDVLSGGVQFVGGTTGEDRLTILNDAARTVSHHVAGPGAGTFGVDGAAISYSGVEVVADQHAPALLGAPWTHPEGSEISMSVQGRDPDATYTMDWTVVQDGETIAMGAGSPFSFTPADNGDYLVTVSSTAPGRTPASASQWIQVQNVSPTIAVSGAAEVTEGGVFTLNLGTITDPGDDTVTHYVVDWGDGSADTYTSGGDVTHVFADNFAPVAVRVNLVDEDGTHFDAGGHLVTVANATPTIEAGSDQTVFEGETINLSSAAFNDLGTLDTHTATIDWGDGTIVAAQVSESPFGPAGSPSGADGTISGSHVYADNGTFTVTVTVRDDDGAEASDTFAVTVNNVAPENVTIEMVGDNQGVFPIGPVAFSGSFTDDGSDDTHTAVWTLTHARDETIVEQQVVGMINQASGGGTLTKEDNIVDFGDVANFSNLGPGVYTLTLTVTDDDGEQTTSAESLFVVYDASEGFVTGGGWIESPEGAYRPDPTLTGKASFGFVSKYKKGANIPTGQTQFRFKAAGLEFESSSYEWLVIAGARAKYKGVGTINGSGNFGFLLTAIDGQHSGGGGVDKFRIKIWDRDNGDGIVYDNQVSGDTSDDAVPTTTLGGGSIVIHDNPQALHADGYGSGQSSSGFALPGDRELAEAFDRAVSAWANAGFDEHDVSHLRGVDVQWTDLSGSLLGMASDINLVWLDRDAAGFGWSVQPNQAGVDLTHVLTHELGHILGLDDDDSQHEVMRGVLEVGWRQPALLSADREIRTFISDPSDPLTAGFAAMEADDAIINCPMPLVGPSADRGETEWLDSFGLREEEQRRRRLERLFEQSADADWWLDALAEEDVSDPS